MSRGIPDRFCSIYVPRVREDFLENVHMKLWSSLEQRRRYSRSNRVCCLGLTEPKEKTIPSLVSMSQPRYRYGGQGRLPVRDSLYRGHVCEHRGERLTIQTASFSMKFNLT